MSMWRAFTHVKHMTSHHDLPLLQAWQPGGRDGDQVWRSSQMHLRPLPWPLRCGAGAALKPRAPAGAPRRRPCCRSAAPPHAPPQRGSGRRGFRPMQPCMWRQGACQVRVLCCVKAGRMPSARAALCEGRAHAQCACCVMWRQGACRMRVLCYVKAGRMPSARAVLCEGRVHAECACCVMWRQGACRVHVLCYVLPMMPRACGPGGARARMPAGRGICVGLAATWGLPCLRLAMPAALAVPCGKQTQGFLPMD